MAFRWSEKLVVEAVVKHFYQQPWLHLPKFRPGAGTGQWAEKEFDCFCFHPWPSENYRRVVVEAKISRSDFLKEAKDPIKKRAGLYCSTEFYFAAPKGCVRDLDEIPSNCGFYETSVDEFGELHCHKKIAAPELADEPPTWNFLAAAVRRILSDENIAEMRKEIEEWQARTKTCVDARKVLHEENQALHATITKLRNQNAKLRQAVNVS